MQFLGNNSLQDHGLGSGKSSVNRGQKQSPDMVWNSSNNPDYGFLGHHIPKVSQLGLSHLYAAKEFRKATVTPHLVRVHTMVEYHRVMDEPGVTLPPLFPGTGEVSVTEIAKPYYPHGLINGDRLILRHECPQNQSSSLANGRRTLARDLPPPPGFETPMNDDFMAPSTIDEHVGSRPQRKVEANPSADHDDELNESPIDNEPIDAKPFQVYLPEDVCNGNLLRRPKVEINNDDNRKTLETDSGINSNAVNNQRRTRNVPYRKYGPYTCPRCMDVFPTSQSFAAHASGHYRRDGRTSIHEPIISIQNASKKHRTNNVRRRGKRVPYVKPGPYTCTRCNAVLRTPNMFAVHMSSHYREEIVWRLSGEASSCPKKNDASTVNWLASTLTKVVSQHGKRSNDKDVLPTISPPGPSSSSSSSSVPREARVAVKMEPHPEDDDEVVEIKAEPWSM